MKKIISFFISAIMLLALFVGFAVDSVNAASDVVELEFLFGDPNRTEIFQRIVDEFNESQDEVHVTYTPTGTNHLDTLMTRLASGDVPDMTSQLQGYELQEYVDAGYIKNIKNEPYLKYIKESQLATVTYNDGIYGLPMDTQAYGIFYNKDLFEQAGIESYPTTVTELEEAVKKLTDAGITPFASGYATEWTIGQFLGYTAAPIITPEVVKLGSDYKKGNWSFDIDGMDRAFDVLDLIINNSQDRAGDTDSSGQYVAFASGKCAMMMQGNWSILQIRELNPEINMGIFPVPVTDDPVDQVFPIQYGFVINVLTATDKDPAKAAAINTFFDYFLNPDGGASYYYDEIGIPTANQYIEDPVLDPASDLLQEYLQEDKTVFTYYCYEPSGFDMESWKVTVEYINEDSFDHSKLITKFNEAFDKYADAL